MLQQLVDPRRLAAEFGTKNLLNRRKLVLDRFVDGF